ncbi:DMT family transporter [Roseibium salinum]|uniref:DMT family transporter n=1 Tax=Roseibium salinum TaxID=1604349 RepID=A0ABT3R2Q4_9HYPH|nr:DMT family transporter [Roseibium sp. DSM 29163]MCX2723519.1 DMT family transporter [Roseibium sp. DSM 29163]
MMISTLPRPALGPTGATLVIAACAACFGLVPLFVRDLQALGAGPATIALYRFGFSALFLLPFVPLERHKRGGALLLAGAGAVLGLSLIGYLEAMTRAPVAAAGVVYMSYPVFAALFAWVLLRQALTWRSFLAAGLVLGAAALLLDPSSLSSEILSALLWAIPAPIAFGFLLVVLSGPAGQLNSLERTVCGLLGSVAGLLPLALQEGQGTVLPSSPEQWGLIVAMGLMTVLIPQVLFTIACQRVGPVRTAAAGSLELPAMFLVGWLVFGEEVGLREAVSALLVLSAILAAPAIRAGQGPSSVVLRPG